MARTLRDILSNANLVGNGNQVPVGGTLDFSPNLPIDIVLPEGRFLKNGNYETDTSKFDKEFWKDNLVAYVDVNNSDMEEISMNTSTGTMFGYTAYDDILHRSTDLGLTWTSVSEFISNAIVPYTDNIDFWMLQVGTDLWSSRDDGLTWQTYKAVVLTIDSKRIKKVGNTVIAFAASSEDKLLVSKDAGLTWLMTTLPSAALCNDIASDGSGMWIISTTTGIFFRSLDDGETWSSITVGSSLNLQKVEHIGGGVFIAATNLGRIFKVAVNGTITEKSNGGLAATVNATAQILSINTPTPEIIIIGSMSNTAAPYYLIHSTDAGETWSAITPPGIISNNDGIAFTAIAANAAGDILITGSSGYIASRAAGAANPLVNLSPASFTRGGNSSVSTKQAFKIIGVDSQRFYLMNGLYKKDFVSNSIELLHPSKWYQHDVSFWTESKQGTRIGLTTLARIWRSTDSGLTNAFITTPAAFTDLVTDHLGTWIGFVSLATSIYVSTDDGLTWTSKSLGIGGLVKVVKGDRGDWIGILNNSSSLIRSTDNGQTWATVAIPNATNNNSRKIDLIYAGLGNWFLTTGQTTANTHGARSTDNGLTWTAINTNQSFATATDMMSGVTYSVGANTAVSTVSTDRFNTSPTTAATLSQTVDRGEFIFYRGIWVWKTENGQLASSGSNFGTWIPTAGRTVKTSTKIFSSDFKKDICHVTSLGYSTSKLLVDVAAGSPVDSNNPNRYIRIK